MKRDREWYRGAKFGYDTALSNIQNRGLDGARAGVVDLRRAARGGTSFDRGYLAAYNEIVNGTGIWYPNGTANMPNR